MLRTKRLRLRRFEPADGELLWRLLSDPAVMRYIDRPCTDRARIERRELPEILAEYHRYADFGTWAAEDETGEFVGRFGLHPAVPTKDPTKDPTVFWERGRPEQTTVASLGYRLVRAAWGKGYATEAAGALVDRAFGELAATEVCATTMAVNTGSRRVLERLGFRHVHTAYLQWADPLPGNDQGDVVYRLSRAGWQNRGI